MDGVTATDDDKLKIISHDPTSSTYNGRISKHDQAKLEPLLIHLHGMCANRQQMLTHCIIVVGKTITTAQLDGLRAKLGLQTYRRRLPGRASELSLSESTIEAPSSAALLEGEQSDISSDQIDSAPPDNTDSPAISRHAFQMADPDVGPASEAEDPILAPLTSFTSAPVSEDDASKFKGAPQRPPMPLLGMPPEDELGELARLTVLQEGFMMKVTTAHDSANTAYDPLTWKCKEFTYLPSILAVRVYSNFAGERPRQRMEARLLHIATLLHALGACEDAFDTFFILYQCIRDRGVTLDQQQHPFLLLELHPLLVFTAIACARSARGELRIRVAHRMAVHVCSWQLPLSSMHELLATFLRDLVKRLFNGMQGQPFHLPIETGIEAAVWALAPFALSISEPDRTRWPDASSIAVSVSAAVETTFNLLSAYDVRSRAFFPVLRFVHDHIREQLGPITREGRPQTYFEYWTYNRALGMSLVLLDKYSKQTAALAALNLINSPAADQFFTCLESLMLVTIPFRMFKKDYVNTPEESPIDMMENLLGFEDDHRSKRSDFVNLCLLESAAARVRSGFYVPSIAPEELILTYKAIAQKLVKFEKWFANPGIGHDGSASQSIAVLRNGPVRWPSKADVIQPPADLDEHRPRSPPEQSAMFPPTMARSYRASDSSSLRSFLSLAARAGKVVSRISDKRRSMLSDSGTYRSSWTPSFMKVATQHSAPSVEEGTINQDDSSNIGKAHISAPIGMIYATNPQISSALDRKSISSGAATSRSHLLQGAGQGDDQPMRDSVQTSSSDVEMTGWI